MQHIFTFFKARKKLSISTLATLLVFVVFGLQIFLFALTMAKVKFLSGVSAGDTLETSLILLVGIPLLPFIKDDTKYFLIWVAFLFTLMTEFVVFTFIHDSSSETLELYDKIEPTYEVQRREWK